MWPLVSPPGVFKARNRAGRVSRHTTDMRDGHSSRGGGGGGGDKMHPHSHLGQGAKTEIQIRSGRQRLCTGSHEGRWEKKKKRKEEIAAFARQLEGSGPRTARACLCASPSWRMSRDADGERRRGPACSAAPRAPRVKSRRGPLTHTLRTRRLFLTFAQ